MAQPRHISWVAKSNGAHANFSVHAGTDSGKDLFVARAQHMGGLIPGKLHVGHSKVYIPFGGEEVSKTQYEVRNETRCRAHYLFQVSILFY